MAIGEVENSCSQKSSSASSLADTTKMKQKNAFISLSLPPSSTSPLPTVAFNLNDSVSHGGPTSLKSEAGSSTSNHFLTNEAIGAASLALKEENGKKMKSLKLCKICQVKQVCVVFLPCGHLICCSDCSTLIANCTICSQAVKGSVKVFLA